MKKKFKISLLIKKKTKNDQSFRVFEVKEGDLLMEIKNLIEFKVELSDKK